MYLQKCQMSMSILRVSGTNQIQAGKKSSMLKPQKPKLTLILKGTLKSDTLGVIHTPPQN